MVIRYMGTKRTIAPVVRGLIDALPYPTQRILDLFGGTGSVLEQFIGAQAVWFNDALQFPVELARARFIGDERPDALNWGRLCGLYAEQERLLRHEFEGRLACEAEAMESQARLRAFIEEAEHVGNSVELAARARSASESVGPARYCMATTYFSAGYFATSQAIAIDSMRHAIDAVTEADGAAPSSRMLSAWVAASSDVMNSTGHSAQFLRPNSASSYARVLRAWSLDFHLSFRRRFMALQPLGTSGWRAGARVDQSDALTLLAGLRADEVEGLVVYADPPYTKDHYSRYYHVHETLYRYDFPDSYGRGRARSDRFLSEFNYSTKVVSALLRLVAECNRLGVPLVLSYPEGGLAARRAALGALLSGNVERLTLPATHSTMGGRLGRASHSVLENVYVVT